VEEARLVGVLQTNGSLSDHLTGFGGREWAAAVHKSGKIDTLDEFHGQEVDPVDLSGVRRCDDILVAQFADAGHLLPKSSNCAGITGSIWE
jgi:hypothetical protein